MFFRDLDILRSLCLFGSKFFLFFICFLSFLVIFPSSVYSGLLKHEVLSPFGNVIAVEQTNYYSGLTKEYVNSKIDTRFKDFREYSDDDISEPYCRIGGQYNIIVTNNARPGSGVSRRQYKLFYCKTTRDLLKYVKIPSSWKNSRLLVYCNDGKNIQSMSTNFDIFTSNINTYKACIVKNLDLTENNVILFGFEVGNRVIDSNKAFYFNMTTKSGPVIVDFLNVNPVSSGSVIEEVYAGMVYVPYKVTVYYYCVDRDGDVFSYSRYYSKAEAYQHCGLRYEEGYDFVPRSYDEALKWVRSNFYSDVSSLVFKRNIEDSHNPSSPSSMYLIKVKEKFPTYIFNMTFNNPSKDKFFFYYDSSKNFYILTNFLYNFDKNYVLLKDLFPKYRDIGFSRVALFYKDGNRYIYGYESPVRLLTKIFGDSILPIYIIRLQNFYGFDQNLCSKLLNKYTTSFGLRKSSQIVCDDNVVFIISNNFMINDQPFIAFNIFKNIILGLIS